MLKKILSTLVGATVIVFTGFVNNAYALGAPIIHQGVICSSCDFVAQYIRFAPAPGTIGYNIYLDGEYKETWYPNDETDYIIDSGGAYCAVAFNEERDFSDCSNSIIFLSRYGQTTFVPPITLQMQMEVQNANVVCIRREIRVNGWLTGSDEVCH